MSLSVCFFSLCVMKLCIESVFNHCSVELLDCEHSGTMFSRNGFHMDCMHKTTLPSSGCAFKYIFNLSLSDYAMKQDLTIQYILQCPNGILLDTCCYYTLEQLVTLTFPLFSTANNLLLHFLENQMTAILLQH